MIVKHSLEFETVIDEDSSAYQTILNMPEAIVKEMFESMLKELVAPRIAPILKELNAGGTFAILRLAE
jgi:hypothetical protein